MSKIWVIGGANIDILGSAKSDLKDYDSNIGEITLSYGGVGRNIAETCALMGADVNFVTCFSDDHFGMKLKEVCESLGINCDYSITVSNASTSIYLAIMDKDGDMRLGMSDMSILENLNFDVVDQALNDISSRDLLILDSNLSSEMLEYIANKSPARIGSDPVSVSKISRLKPIVSKLSIFKPNAIEAEELSGIKLVDKTSYVNALSWFRNKGVKETLITMADKGVLLGTEDKMLWFKHRKVEVDNTTGGGDSFFGTYVSKRMEGLSPMDATKLAISSAILHIEEETGNRRRITGELVESQLDSMKIQIEEL